MKKILKVFGIVAISFAVVFAVSVAATSTTTSAAKVKKLKFKKKSVTIKVGEKKKLGLTVKPKKAKIKWSSSKKKVATVSQKGVVKAKKTGKTVITAKSGKKKATCKVSVTAVKKKTTVKAGISSVEILDSKRVRVTLNKAYALSASNFSLKTKSQKAGAYKKSLKVESVTNSANKVYEVILATDTDSYSDGNAIDSQSYLNVTVSKLPGVKSKEVVNLSKYALTNAYVSGVVGDTIDYELSYSTWAMGNCTFTVSKLPAGIRVEKYGNYIVFLGNPTAVCNGTRVTVTATDELGNKNTRYVYFYIGSSNKLVTYTTSTESILLAGDNYSEYLSLYAEGGSGNYKYELVSNTNNNIAISYDEIYVNDSILPGKYTVTYKVTDLNTNASVTAKKSFTVQKAVKVAGTVKSADGSLLEDAELEFDFSDKNSSYYKSGFYSSSSTDGKYEVYVAPNQTYSIYAWRGNGEKYYRGQKVATTAKTINLSLPVYAVTLVASDGSSIPYNSWYNKTTGKYLDSGSVLYLKKGTYTISDTVGIKKYAATFTVAGKRNVTLSVSSIVKGTLALNGTISSTVPNCEYTYYAITPTETGVYNFNLTNITNWISARIYAESDLDSSIASNSTYGTELSLESVALFAGKTYYIRLYADEGDANFSLTYALSAAVETLPLDETISSTVEDCKYKYYKVTPAATGVYDFNLTNITSWISVGVYEGSDFNTSLASNSTSGSTLSLESVSLTAGKTYYIRMYADEGDAGFSLTYSLNAGE